MFNIYSIKTVLGDFKQQTLKSGANLIQRFLSQLNQWLVVCLHNKVPAEYVMMKVLYTIDQSVAFTLNVGIPLLCGRKSSRMI